MDFSKNKAIYEQISDHLSEEILKGVWDLGEKIPSVREVAVSLEVNPNTVVRSYTALEQAGIIEVRRGVGYFVSTSAKETILRFKKENFLKEELPKMFKAMEILGISPDEVARLYHEREQ